MARQQCALLGRLVGNMFEPWRALEVAERGPKGGVLAYTDGQDSYPPRVIRRMKKLGYLDAEGRPTRKGVLVYRDQLAGWR